MRKLLATICLSLVFFSQAGYYGIFAIEQAIIRETQKRKMLIQLDNAQLEAIPEHKDMDFIDGGKEFYLHGELYDVVRTAVVNGKKVYYALNDKRESEVLKKMADIGKNNAQKNAKKNTLKFATVIVEPLPEYGFNGYILSQMKGRLHEENLLSRCSDILPPPPDRIG